MHRLLSDRARGWRRALCGVAFGLLAWSAHGVPAKAPQDLRIDGEVLPGKSVDLLEQALSRVKFNTDPQQLRRGLVENRLLARAVEDQLTAQSRADLDASVEIEAGNLLEQVYGRRYREDLGPYLRQPRALSAERLREVLAPRSRGLVENSLLLDETQRREAAGVELIGWRFPASRHRSSTCYRCTKATTSRARWNCNRATSPTWRARSRPASAATTSGTAWPGTASARQSGRA
ncbi:hypothetical protein P4114_09010 [Pseudomonas aeruginosa]|nr:hypothetical protein [Pseudomonas aeruginosa]